MPEIHLVNIDYAENNWALKSKKEGVRVIGHARQNYHWQAKAEKSFALKDFSIGWENK